MPIPREIVTTQIPANQLEPVFGDDDHVITVNGISGHAGEGFGWMLENCVLTTDLECNHKKLLNVARVLPVPSPLIDTDDPRLSDARIMIAGSVTNESVADDAGIQQFKLNLNGSLPPNYLISPDSVVTTGDPLDPLEVVTGDDNNPVTAGGVSQQTTEPVITNGDLPEFVFGDDGNIVTVRSPYPPLQQYAARGDLVQYATQKGQPNGYCPLDGTGRMPSAFYSLTGPGSGTVNHVGLSIPGEFSLPMQALDHGSGIFAVTWGGAPPLSWFGGFVSGGLSTPKAPAFHTEQLSPDFIPGLNASIIASGLLDSDSLPIAKMGAPSAPGIVPDPGATGNPADYLARDMTYKTPAPPPSYEPVVPNPSIVLQIFSGTQAGITVTDSLAGASLFYRVNFTGQFIPVPVGEIFVDQGATIEAYAAKIGYTNSAVVSFHVPTP